MRIYGIYKVKKQYEHFIFGREHLLHDLLKGNLYEETSRQEVHYLCDYIEQELVEDVVVPKLIEVFDTVQADRHRYELAHTVKGEIVLLFSPHAIIVHCKGSRMLDLDLFASLSEVDRYFFAVMEGENEWGWLKPMKFEHVPKII